MNKELIDYFLESIIANLKDEYEKQQNINISFEEYAVHRLNDIADKLVKEY